MALADYESSLISTPPPIMKPETFDNRGYTFEALVEELALLERHIRDGSWRFCKCIPEKHFPLLAGLAGEGYIFSEDPEERRYMARLRDFSKIMKRLTLRENLGQEDMDKIAEWAREVRLQVEKFAEGQHVKCSICSAMSETKAITVKSNPNPSNPNPNPIFNVEDFGWVGIVALPLVAVGCWFLGNLLRGGAE